MKVLKVNVMEETNEELLNLNSENELAMLQASESNESRCDNFQVNYK